VFLFQHDIIRDYTLAAHTPNELQQRQRCFCQCLIDISTNGEEITATVSIRTYASTLMHFHVLAAAFTPLSNDALVQSWLLRQDDIGYRAVEGVGSSNTNDLAIWFRDNKHDYWSAALLWKTLAHTTAAPASKSQYLRSSVAALAQIPEGTQPGKLDLEIDMNNHLAYFSDRQGEKDSAIEWLVGLAADPSQMQELAAVPKGQVLHLAALTFFGQTNSKFCWTRSSEQIRRGARFFMRGTSCYLESANSLQIPFWKWFCWALALGPPTSWPLCYTCLEEMHDYALVVLGEGGVELIKWHDS
jgi:hypothetical protein